MSNEHSDALVFFGATGDLAYKKIFPALQAMVKRGNLNVPVVGVAKAGWNLDQLRARAKDSLEKHGGVDPAAFEKLSGLLRYVDGDYQDPATFEALREQLKDAHRPAYYLAIPPVLFETVVENIAKSHRRRRCAGHRRKALRARSGLGPGAEQDSPLHLRRIQYFPNRSFPRQAAGGQHAGLSLRQCLRGSILESPLHRERADHHGGRFRSSGTRRILRRDRRDPRRRSEPSVSGALQSGDGAAGRDPTANPCATKK